LQDNTPAPVAPVVPPPPPPPSLMPPLLAAMGGAMAVGIGIALFATMPDCHASSIPTACDDNRFRSALAGGLIGAGGVTALVGTTVTISRARWSTEAGPARAPAAATPTATTTTVSLTVPF
jgi:hypothetical protein